MIKLLMIADDFTGAFDTGVQFAARGATTIVVTDPTYALQSIGKTVEVLVMVAETRHLPPQEAYEIVYRTVRGALQAGIPYIYKKTDSALRGNVGSELAALMDATGTDVLPFLPALPKLNRVTKAGIHYIDGVPVAQSVFGQDPFEPVLDSAVAEILGRQTAAPVVIHEKQETYESFSPGIQLFNAETDADLRRIGGALGLERLKFCAGCAGFAEVLAELLHLKGQAPQLPPLKKALFISCGSVNPVTICQMKEAREQGFPHVNLTPVQKLDRRWVGSAASEVCVGQWLAQVSAENRFILDANDPEGCRETDFYAQKQGLTRKELRVRISDNLAALMKQLLDSGLEATLLCTGGDTLLALMRAVEVSALTPICEIATGVVLTEFIYNGKKYHIISKSGGFGQRDLFVKLAKQLSCQSTTHEWESHLMNYPTLPGLTPDGRLYRNEEMGTVESMIPPGPFATCHSPAMLALPNGDMLCCWFAGTYEGEVDVHIVCARLSQGADRWTEPVTVSSDPHRSEQNPSLFYGPDGAVWCLYTAQLDRVAGKDNMQFTSQIRCQRSFDGGLTWGDHETMFPREGSFCRQPIQILKNGRWIFGNWLCTDSTAGLSGDPSVFQLSDDQGKTWRMVEMPNSHGRVHPTVVELENGHLAAFMRSREADNIYRSESLDWGETWSEPKPTPLPNNNSSISAIRTRSGRVAVAYNPTCAPVSVPGKAAWPGLRCPVAVALSEDGGLTFPMIRWMERGEGYIGAENQTNNKQYEYPYLMQSTDGRLHLTYAAYTRKCIKCVSFTEEDVAGVKRERGGVYNPTSGEGTK